MIEIRTNPTFPRNAAMLMSPGAIALTRVYFDGSEIVVEAEVDRRKVVVVRPAPEGPRGDTESEP